MKNIFHISEIEGLESSVFGRKAANLSTLYKMDKTIIPEAIIIDKDASRNYIDSGGDFPKGFDKEIEKGIKKIEKLTKLRIGDNRNPLILAVRISLENEIEGVKNYILNVGFNDETVEGLINHYGRHKFALETYCRSVYEFATKALGVSKESLDKQKDAILTSEKIAEYNFLNEKHLKELVSLYKAVVFKETGTKYPEDPLEQLRIAIETIYDSYDSKRARTYRKIHSIEDKGCSVIIQKMCFGNLGVGSVSGFIESRNPIDGRKEIFGQFIHEGQGTDMNNESFDILNINMLEKRFPEPHKRLTEVSSGLEILTKGPVSLDFTIEDNELNITDIKSPKTSAKAELSIVADMLREEIIDTNEAINSLGIDRLDQIFYPEIDPRSQRNLAFSGLSASNGIVQGNIYFDLDRANNSTTDTKRILIVDEVKDLDSKFDYEKIDGFLSLSGGMGSFIAEHSRNNGKPCVLRCNGIEYVNWKDRYLETNNGLKINEGTKITIDANTGEILIGDVLINQPDITANLKYILTAADQVGKMRTYLKTDNEATLVEAKKIGLENIGYFNLGNFILEPDVVNLVRDKVFKLGINKFSDLESEIITLLKNKIKSLILSCNDGEINFVLYDKGINELIPDFEEASKIANILNVDTESLNDYFNSKSNKNPDFGVTGAKLYTEYPGLFNIQVRSVIEATIEANKALISRSGKIKITVPSISNKEETAIFSKSFQVIKSDYDVSEELNLSLGMKIDNMRSVLAIDLFLGYIDHILIDLEKITSSAYGIGYNDGYQHMSHKNNRYEYDPFERLDIELFTIPLTRLIDKFKGSTKGEIGVVGRQVLNKVTINFLDTIGADYVVTTYKNNLITRIGAAQSRLTKIA